MSFRAIAGIHSNLSSPTRLGIQCFLLFLLLTEIRNISWIPHQVRNDREGVRNDREGVIWRCSKDCKNLVNLYVNKKNEENGSYMFYCTLTTILNQFRKAGEASASLPKGEYMITPKKAGCGFRCGGVSAVGCNCSSCKCSGENAIFAITCDCTEINISFLCY